MAQAIEAFAQDASVMTLAARMLAILAAVLSAANSSAQQGGANLRIERGHELFTYWCATCHGSGPGHGGTTALAFKYQDTKPALLEDRTDLDPSQVTYYVRHGISIMPFFRKTEISDRDLDDIAAYLARNFRAGS